MERTLGYEKCDGYLVNRKWGSAFQAATVPAWVRNLDLVPTVYKYASMAPDLHKHWDEELIKICLDFWMLWHSHKRRGEGLALLGASGTGKSFGAAALANEIEHAHGRDQHINIEWISVPWAISELHDMKHFFMKEDYHHRKWRWYKADLLILDDIFQVPAANSFAVVSEIIAIYHYRMDNLLPTVITGNADTDAWKTFEQVFNVPFARRVRENCEGRTLILGGK